MPNKIKREDGATNETNNCSKIQQSQLQQCENNCNNNDNVPPSISSSIFTNNIVHNEPSQNISGGKFVNAAQTIGTAEIHTTFPLTTCASDDEDSAVRENERTREKTVVEKMEINSNSDSDSDSNMDLDSRSHLKSNSEKLRSRLPKKRKLELDLNLDSNVKNLDTGDGISNQKLPSQIYNVNINQPIQHVQAQNCQIVNAIQTVNPLKPPKTSLKGLGNLPNPPSHFTGRINFLKELKTTLKNRENKNPPTSNSNEPLSRLVVIKGSGGIGKSSVAKQYAKRYSEKYNGNIAWINAETRASVTDSFVKLAQNLEIAGGDKFCESAKNDIGKEDDFATLNSLVNGVYSHLNNNQEAFKSALFILDNAQQLQDARAEDGEFQFGMSNCFPKVALDFLPVFLATSRIINWGLPGDKIPKLDLDKFCPDESIEYLLQVCNCDEWDSSSRVEEADFTPLVEILDGFPLALELAAAAISSEWDESTPKEDKKRDIERYLTDFHKDGRHWASREMPITCSKEYDKILSNVWEGTIRRIKGKKREGQMALRLLKISSFLHTDFISCRLLHFVHKKMVITRRSKGDLNLNNEVVQLTLSGLKLLKKFSMLKMDNMLNAIAEEAGTFFDSSFFYNDKGVGKIYIHRLVQKMERVKFTVPMQVKNTRGHWALFPPLPPPPPPHYSDTEIDLCDLNDLLQFVRQNLEFFQRSGSLSIILYNVKDSKWPGQSYRDYLAIVFQGLEFKDDDRKTADARTLLHVKDVYDLITKQPSSERDEEFLVMCKLFLVHLNHPLIFIEPILAYYGMSEVKKEKLKHKLRLEVTLDNSAIFHGDELSEISVGQFLHWVLDKACLYLHNPWLQSEAVGHYENLNRQLQPHLLQQAGLHQKLLHWFKRHHNEVLNSNPNLSSTSDSLVSFNYEYQTNFEAKQKNLQWTSMTLFKLAAPFLTLEQAIGAITQTVGNRKSQSQHQQDIFNCWEYFEQNLKHVPGIPWTLWSQNQNENEFELAANTKNPNWKLMTENQVFVDQIGEVLQNYVKDYQIKRAISKKRREATKAHSNYGVTPEAEEDYLEMKKHKEELVYPKYTIDLIRVLLYDDHTARNVITLNPGLPLALKNTLTCLIDACTSYMRVDTQLHDAILTWLALLPHVLSSSVSSELKDFVMTTEEKTQCQNIFKAESKHMKEDTQRKTFKPSSYKFYSRKDTTLTRQRIIDKFKGISSNSDSDSSDYSSWTQLAQHLEQFGNEVEGAMEAFEEHDRKCKELYQGNLNQPEDETSALADFMNEFL